MLSLDSQSVKSVAFVNQDKGIDGNKFINEPKRHIIVDTLGLVWGVVVHAADIHDGQKAHLLAAAAAVEHCLGYLEQMQKILVDSDRRYGCLPKKNLQWGESTIIGLEIEFASRPPTSKGFVPIR